MAGSLVSRTFVCLWTGGRCAEAKSQRVWVTGRRVALSWVMRGFVLGYRGVG